MGKKRVIRGKNRARFHSIRGTFGTELAEKMAEEAKMNLTPQEKELLFDHTFLLPQYQILELIKKYCTPRNCHECNIGYRMGGNFVDPGCVENFWGLK
jgi:hypothetical protein